VPSLVRALVALPTRRFALAVGSSTFFPFSDFLTFPLSPFTATLLSAADFCPAALDAIFAASALVDLAFPGFAPKARSLGPSSRAAPDFFALIQNCLPPVSYVLSSKLYGAGVERATGKLWPATGCIKRPNFSLSSIGWRRGRTICLRLGKSPIS
jgi:hypothetical protein